MRSRIGPGSASRGNWLNRAILAMLDGSWVREKRSLLLHVACTPCWPTRSNGLTENLALASTITPARNAAVAALVVGGPLGSRARAARPQAGVDGVHLQRVLGVAPDLGFGVPAAARDALRRQEQVGIEHDPFLAELVPKSAPVAGEPGA